MFKNQIFLLALVLFLSGCEGSHTAADWWNTGIPAIIGGIVLFFVLFVVGWSIFKKDD